MVRLTGFALPAETAAHERTLIAWPVTARRDDVWRGDLGDVRAVHAEVAAHVSRHEPVTMFAAPGDAGGAQAACGEGVEVVELALDDSWLRDTGPIVTIGPGGGRRALHFCFNAWGGKYPEYGADATAGARIAEHLRLPVVEMPLVFEGGSVVGDGDGLLVTTERCLLNANRNPHLTRAEIEATLLDALGAEQMLWLHDGIAEDDETDGHVDNVVAFSAPRRALLQGCDDPGNPNHEIAADNRRRLEADGVEVVEIPVLPYTPAPESLPVPYLNFYVGNGVVVVPVTGHHADGDALALIGREYPGRTVVGVDGEALAVGGGGVHCITQPVPACEPEPT